MKLSFTGRCYALWQLMRMDKPIGSLLLLWPTLWAMWIASAGIPDLKLCAIFVLGVFVMRSAGCVINDYADRHFDGHVKRTAQRPLPSGRVSPRDALILFAVLILIALVLVLQLNLFTIALSVGGALLAAVYPFMKRYTQLPQLVLGMAFSWSIPMAYAAVAGSVNLITWLLFCANVLWTIAYDTMYAMVDRDDDLKIGVKSTAILFGEHDKRIIGWLQFLTLALLAGIGFLAHLHTPYFFSLWIAAAYFLWQQHLIRFRNRDACFQAFLNNNWVGLFIFIGIVPSV